MNKAIEYLESKKKLIVSNGTDKPDVYITLEHAKIALRIPEIEKDLNKLYNTLGNSLSPNYRKHLTNQIKLKESEIENLMKS